MRSPSDHFHWSRSNGRPRTSGVAQGVAQRIIRRAANYVMALFGILLITLVAVVFNAIFGIPPFLFFGIGVCMVAVTAGASPALVSVLLAMLLSDFFLVQPTFHISLNRRVLQLGVFYLIGATLSYLTDQHLTRKRRTPTQMASRFRSSLTSLWMVPGAIRE